MIVVAAAATVAAKSLMLLLILRSEIIFIHFISPDPYVKVEMYVNGIREGKNKCKVRQNTQDPVWHHQVVFEVNRENPKLLGYVFVFHVLHKDMMTGVHKIGQVSRLLGSCNERCYWLKITFLGF